MWRGFKYPSGEKGALEKALLRPKGPEIAKPGGPGCWERAASLRDGTRSPLLKAIHAGDKSGWQVGMPWAQEEGTELAGAAGDVLQTPWVRMRYCPFGISRDG